ncbi:phosphopantetheine-binding protein [Streptomyces sp. NPDC001407]|uniref:phosphopantetheine-binding protein n=1 Tax=unclassified Streptomyces TaxID=2593676 RepID=UPI0033CE81DF
MVSEAEPRHQLTRDGTRQAIGRIWGEVLRLEDLGTDDNFFELGGHSLTASQVIARMARTLHVEITMADFFERPTVDGLTDLVVHRGATAGGAPE